MTVGMGRRKPASICLKFKPRAVVSARITTRHALHNQYTSSEEAILTASVCPLTVGQSSEQFGKFYRPAIILCAQMASAGADDFQLVGVPPMKRRTKEDRSGVALGAGISPFGVAWSTTCGNASASTVRILSGSVPADMMIRDLVLRENFIDVIRCNGLLITTHP